MANFAVWAPRAQSMDLVLDTGRWPMSAGPDSWWHTEVSCPAGTRYRFAPNGSATGYPDPRSRRQPDGVHGPSQLCDVSQFPWTDQQWSGRPLIGSVIYEVHIGTFTPGATLDTAIAKLPYLVELGVDFVQLLPVAAFNGPRNWGYDGTCWFAVDEDYGGPFAYCRFVNACHAAGLGVIQDVVYNHLGPSGNYLPHFGPYLTENRNTWGNDINLDGPGSDEVRQYLLDNVAMWLRDYHVDGLRLDAVHAFTDRRARHILEDIAAQAEVIAAQRGQPLPIIAESDRNDGRLITPSPGGYGLTAQWNDDFHHAVHAAITGEQGGYYADFGQMSAIAKVLQDGFFHDGSYSTFRQRRHGRPVDKSVVHPGALVVCTDNHDQIGNRATGDRPSTQLSDGLVAASAALLLCAPFTPMLFMGQEWAASTPWQYFTAHPEPDLAQAVAQGRLTEFAALGWPADAVPDPQATDTYTRSVLDWTEADTGRHRWIRSWYRQLIALRKAYPGLATDRWPDIQVQTNEPQRTITVRRGGIVLAVSLHDQPVVLPVPDAGPVLATSGALTTCANGRALLDGPGAVIFADARYPAAASAPDKIDP